jgi:hypothetical protein
LKRFVQLARPTVAARVTSWAGDRLRLSWSRTSPANWPLCDHLIAPLDGQLVVGEGVQLGGIVFNDSAALDVRDELPGALERRVFLLDRLGLADLLLGGRYRGRGCPGPHQTADTG